MNYEEKIRCHNEAVKFLGSRMRTEKELREKLKEKGFCESVVDETVEEAKKLKYIDDYQYALLYFEYAYGKKRGKYRIFKELEKKGILREISEEALYEYNSVNKVDEYSTALEIAFEELKRNIYSIKNCKDIYEKKKNIKKILGSIARKLQNLGYEKDVIYGVLDNLKNSLAEERSI